MGYLSLSVGYCSTYPFIYLPIRSCILIWVLMAVLCCGGKYIVGWVLIPRYLVSAFDRWSLDAVGCVAGWGCVDPARFDPGMVGICLLTGYS